MGEGEAKSPITDKLFGEAILFLGAPNVTYHIGVVAGVLSMMRGDRDVKGLLDRVSEELAYRRLEGDYFGHRMTAIETCNTEAPHILAALFFIENMILSNDSNYIGAYVRTLLIRYAENIASGTTNSMANQDRNWHLAREKFVREGFAKLEKRILSHTA
jgi:hypothetical protein